MPFQMLTFTVCNRHEFHDLAALLTQVMAQRNPPIIYTHPVYKICIEFSDSEKISRRTLNVCY